MYCKGNCSQLAETYCTANVLHVDIARKNPCKNTGVIPWFSSSKKIYVNNLLESHVMT